MPTFGRKPIFTRYKVVDETTIIDVLKEAYPNFCLQRRDARHLFDVYRGKQAVLNRTKEIRPEINNKVIRNHANEIVSFKVSYLLADPIKYVSRSSDEVTDEIAELNDYMYLVSKETLDKQIADDFNITGIAYRIVLPNGSYVEDDGTAPFEIYTLSPDTAFVIKDGGLGHKVLAGVYVEKRMDDKRITSEVACVYTDREYFEVDVRTFEILKHSYHTLGAVPIVEYINNDARLGSFEIVESLLDAINTLESNRLDGVEQAIQNILVFKNVEVTRDGMDEIRSLGAVNIKAPQGVDADVTSLTTNMVQSDQQVLMDSMYRTVLSISGMPAPSDNVSDSSNNGAVFMRSGWYAADARAKDSEKLWRKSEMECLKLVLKICETQTSLKLKAEDVGIKFTRRNYEDILSKSQTLTNMLSAGIHPQYAIEQSGLFYDPAEVYKASMPYLEKWKTDQDGELDDNDPDNPNKAAHNHDDDGNPNLKGNNPDSEGDAA